MAWRWRATESEDRRVRNRGAKPNPPTSRASSCSPVEHGQQWSFEALVDSLQSHQQNPDTTGSDSELPPETIDFAHRMFDAAREGNATLLLAAIDAGLPPNLTNEKGTSYYVSPA